MMPLPRSSLQRGKGSHCPDAGGGSHEATRAWVFFHGFFFSDDFFGGRVAVGWKSLLYIVTFSGPFFLWDVLGKEYDHELL